ncbi:hypothetical protein [Paucibacter soli]|uniref:hypothetical protein n=1 Tax=Paucibacter soli TaxID=3133433 RepID=UPI003097A6B3
MDEAIEAALSFPKQALSRSLGALARHAALNAQMDELLNGAIPFGSGTRNRAIRELQIKSAHRSELMMLDLIVSTHHPNSVQDIT